MEVVETVHTEGDASSSPTSLCCSTLGDRSFGNSWRGRPWGLLGGGFYGDFTKVCPKACNESIGSMVALLRRHQYSTYLGKMQYEIKTIRAVTLQLVVV